MPSDFSSYKVALDETSSDTKFDAFVQAVEDAVNGIGALAVDPSQITGYPSDSTKYLDGGGHWSVPFTVVRGRVSSAGATLGGTGFTPSKTGTGQYQIALSVAFAAAPAVLVTALCGGTPQNVNVVSFNVLAGSFGVKAYTIGAVDSDQAFNFVAIGV